MPNLAFCVRDKCVTISELFSRHLRHKKMGGPRTADRPKESLTYFAKQALLKSPLTSLDARETALAGLQHAAREVGAGHVVALGGQRLAVDLPAAAVAEPAALAGAGGKADLLEKAGQVEIGRASCRERV